MKISPAQKKVMELMDKHNCHVSIFLPTRAMYQTAFLSGHLDIPIRASTVNALIDKKLLIQVKSTHIHRTREGDYRLSDLAREILAQERK